MAIKKDRTLSGYAGQSGEKKTNISEEQITSTTRVSRARNQHKAGRCNQYVPLKNRFTSSRLRITERQNCSSESKSNEHWICPDYCYNPAHSGLSVISRFWKDKHRLCVVIFLHIL